MRSISDPIAREDASENCTTIEYPNKCVTSTHFLLNYNLPRCYFAPHSPTNFRSGILLARFFVVPDIFKTVKWLSSRVCLVQIVNE